MTRKFGELVVNISLVMIQSMRIFGPLRMSSRDNHCRGAPINQVSKIPMQLLLVGLSSQPAPRLLQATMASETEKGVIKVFPPALTLYHGQYQ